MADAPQVIFNIKDESATSETPVVVYPLDKQLYLIKAQEGESGIKYFQTFSACSKYYGAETFNENNSTYFSNSSMFLRDVLTLNGAWVHRLVPDNATKANMVLYATVQANDIPQYQKAADGSRVVNASGDWVPLLVETVPVTQPGYTIVLSVEPLDADEEYNTLLPVTTVIPLQANSVKYPICALELKAPCLAGNSYGFEFYIQPEINTLDNVLNTKHLKFTLRLKKKVYNSSVMNFVRDDYSNIESKFTLINNVVDSALNIAVGIDDVLMNNFTGTNSLPFNIFSYEDNIVAIDTLIKGVLTTTEEGTLGDLLDDMYSTCTDFVTGVNPFSMIEYDRIAVTNTIARRNVTNFLLGGTDGTLTSANEQTMVQNFLALESYPDVLDNARFPFTALVDSGYDLAIKYAMIDFLDSRRDVAVILTPYQASHAQLTKDEEFSVGQALYARALLTQESILYGVDACRACIMLQSGPLTTSTKNRIVPATHWVATKMAETYNKTYLDAPMLSWPYSINDQFKYLNWYPVKLDFKNKLYGNGMNYTQYLDANTLHVPALRSVHPHDTSKLVDFPFVLVCIFIQQLTRYIGMKHTGSELAANLRHFAIQKDVEKNLSYMLNNQYLPTISVGQTAEESALGYVDHVYINLPADKAMTMLKVDLIVQKPQA